MVYSSQENIRNWLKQRKFVGLMDLYDKNYLRLQQLIPDLQALPSPGVTQVPGHPDLYFEFIEASRFTSSFRLTYLFEYEQEGHTLYIRDPDLTLRVYHDARVVEAISCQLRGFMPLSPEQLAQVGHLECRWDSNLFLQKWLEYLLDSGYLLIPARVTSPQCMPRVNPLEVVG